MHVLVPEKNKMPKCLNAFLVKLILTDTLSPETGALIKWTLCGHSARTCAASFDFIRSHHTILLTE